MVDEKTLITALEDAVAAGKMTGESRGAIVKTLSERSQIPLRPEDFPAARLGAPPAMAQGIRALNPADVKSLLESGGASFRKLVEDLAESSAGVKKLLTDQELTEAVGKAEAPLIKTVVAARGAAKANFLQWLDLDFQQTRAMWDSALAAIEKGDRSLAQRIRSLTAGKAPHGDLETFARNLVKKLPKSDRAPFLRAVHDRICDEIAAQLRSVVGDPSVLEQIDQALAAAKKSGGNEFTSAFRDRLRALFADSSVGDTLTVILAGLDGTARQRFLEQAFEAIGDPATLKLLNGQFDTDGLRRLLTAYASFRKMYTVTRMSKALENLIGWMYEASKFVADLAGAAAAQAQQSLIKAVHDAKLNVTVGQPLLHFNVQAPSLSGQSWRQATDVFGTIPLTVGNKTVHVLVVGLESKGERGIPSGIAQLANLVKRLARKSVVSTEHQTFTVGTDLFLSVDEAMRALGTPAAVSADIAQAVRGGKGGAYAAIVVSPLGSEQAEAMYGPLFAGKNIRYAAHPVPRTEMKRAAESIAPHFDLLPRQAK